MDRIQQIYLVFHNRAGAGPGRGARGRRDGRGRGAVLPEADRAMGAGAGESVGALRRQARGRGDVDFALGCQ